MNKKAISLVSSIFILIVVIILILGGGRLILNAGNSLLGIFNLVNVTEVDYSQLNKDAQSSFNNLVKDIEACKNSKDINCLCYTSLAGFDKVHKLEIGNSEIKLLNIKDNNVITMNKKAIQDFNCYYTENSVEVENPLTIEFDESQPALKKEFMGIGILAKNVNFYSNPAIYKSNKLCLASTDFKVASLNKVCKT